MKRGGILTSVVIIDLLLQSYFRSKGFGVLNPGVSFGLLPGLGQGIAVIIYPVFALIFFGLSKKSLAFMLLAFGGLGNLLPRIFWHGVWDYLYLPVLPFWFNFSDVMISLGVVSYILRGNGNHDIV